MTPLLLVVLLADVAIADTEEAVAMVADSIEQSILAKEIKRQAPRYPGHELRRGREAWVHVAYCIDESGAVQNVSILDSIGSESFDKAALKTVQTWKYEPALQNGEPTWQSRNEVYINFAISGDNKGADHKFARQFRKIGEQINAGNTEEADALFQEVYNNYDLSLYELGKLWAQRVRHEAKVGDFYKLHMALTRATASHGEWIDKDSYVRLLKLRTQVEVKLGKYHEAMQSFDDLVDATREDSEDVTALRPMMDRLQSMIDGDKAIPISAEVRVRGDCNHCNDSWDFTPVRREFTFVNIKGSLNSIDMRCDHKRVESAVSEQVDWHLPEKWGKCHVQIYGEPGTTFDVLMLPANQG